MGMRFAWIAVEGAEPGEVFEALELASSGVGEHFCWASAAEYERAREDGPFVELFVSDE